MNKCIILTDNRFEACKVQFNQISAKQKVTTIRNKEIWQERGLRLIDVLIHRTQDKKRKKQASD